LATCMMNPSVFIVSEFCTYYTPVFMVVFNPDLLLYPKKNFLSG
jgi:hypothetical protein